MRPTIARTHIVGTYNIHGRNLDVSQTAWTNSDRLSYDVSDRETGFPLHNGSFDALPTRDQVETLITSLVTMHNERDVDHEVCFFCASEVHEFLCSLSDYIEISLSVDNRYERYDDVHVQHEHKVVLAPPNYTVEWEITTDGTRVKHGVEYVLAANRVAAALAATERARLHTEFDPRLSPRVSITAITAIDPADNNDQEWAQWAHTNIIDPFTGVGHEDGDSWYDITITACSIPTLIGKTFNWGY